MCAKNPTTGEYVVLLACFLPMFQMKCQNSRAGISDFWNLQPRILHVWNFQRGFRPGINLPAGFFPDFQWGIFKHRGLWDFRSFMGFSMGFKRQFFLPNRSRTKPIFSYTTHIWESEKNSKNPQLTRKRPIINPYQRIQRYFSLRKCVDI